jgi:hypothetical protein
MREPPEALEFTEDSCLDGIGDTGSEAQLVYEARYMKILFPDDPRATNG